MSDVISSLLPHALNYAENWKFAVFPAPLGTKKSHKSEQYSGTPWGATRDLDEIRRDFTKWPDANIGIPTGKDNGIFVCEVDTIEGHGKDGFASLAALEAEHGKLPDTLMAESPSGGIHYFFRHPGFDVKNSESEIADGIDIRGDGGMVIIAPSRKEDGRAWRWLNAPHAIADAPQWMEGRVKAERAPKASVGTARVAPTGLRPTPGLQPARALEEACKRVAAAEEGTRNGVLNDQAFFVGHWVGSGEIGADVAAYDLLAACGECGLHADDGADQCLATIHSGLAAGAKEPARTTDDMFPPDFIRQVVADMAAKAGATPRRRTLIERRVNAASLAGKTPPAREWFVPDWIPNGQVSLVYGDGGVGKSLVATHLAVCAAAGVPWFARSVKRGVVEFITAEDSADELHRRVADISRENGIPIERMDGLNLYSFADADAIMAALQGDGQLVKTGFYDEVETVCKASKPVAVVLDTLADIYGGNEVIRQQVRSFIAMLRKIAIDNNCAVIVLAHPSLSGINTGKGTSGSTGWNNSVRSRLYLTRETDETGHEPDEDLRVLKLMKSNYSKIGTEVRMRYQRGTFVPDRIIVGGGDPVAKASTADRVFLELLATFTAQNRPVNVATGRNYAPAVFAKSASPMGVSKRELESAMERLLRGGRIANVPYGPPSRGTHRLVVAQ